MKSLFITTPIYYVNDVPHVGHAYTTIAADTLARFWRARERDVFLLTGTDEHGAKIEEAARKAHTDNQTFVDERSAAFRNAWDQMGIQYDGFIRTSDPKHKTVVQKVLQQLFDKGFIKKGEYEGLYCAGCEQYKTPNDLVDGLCPDHKRKPEVMKEETYLFLLSQFQDRLIDAIKSGELLIEPPERYREVLGFLTSQKLQDISISRARVKWGVPLPFDPAHTTYVWVDAFFNYLTGIGWEGDPQKLPKEWPVDLHLVGKDILRVHTTIWPALLMALGISLPKKIFAHGYFTIDGVKMSKSLGNALDPVKLANEFGNDALRYYLLSEIPFGQDGDVSVEGLKKRHTADLANGLGNLLSRTEMMIEKFCGGLIPEKVSPHDALSDVDALIENFKFHDAVKRIWKAVGWANLYIDENKPWALAKAGEQKKIDSVLSEVASQIVEIAKKLSPIMPATSQKILARMTAEKITRGEPLFPRL